MAGIVVWEGLSRYNSKPIVVIATNNSANIKTGDMIQTWILLRDINPVEALKTGKDKAICGQCPLRNNICYVNVGQAPLAVWKTYQNQKYDYYWTDDFFRGQSLRIGSYGDPCMVPLTIWKRLLQWTKNHTGYTHQWKIKRNQKYSSILMASIDSDREYQWAKMLGWRTFRLKKPSESKLSTEVICPASIEGGNKAICKTCVLCSGNQRPAKNVVINVHGPTYKIQNYSRILNE